MGRTSGACYVAIAALGTLPALGCSGAAGDEGTDIPVPFEALSGGVVFSTRAIRGANGYDLYWVPLPVAQTIDPQPVIQLTRSGGDDWQPSVSRGGQGLVFARYADGIFFVARSGRVSRVSDTNGTSFKDSLPAISADGSRVAWVREDLARPIGETGFFETTIMMAAFDGTNAGPVSQKPGVVQDAPAFDPTPNATRLAWSEFNPANLTVQGPQAYGVWIQDFVAGSGRFACESPAIVIGDRAYRCFGQHLTWPRSDVVVLGQDLLEIDIFTGGRGTIWPEVIHSIQTQQTGFPDIAPSPIGFFPRFPLSISYSPNLDRVIFDGIIRDIDGDTPSLSFFVAGIDGGGVWRLPIGGHSADIDPTNTADYLFSVATPQIIP